MAHPRRESAGYAFPKYLTSFHPKCAWWWLGGGARLRREITPLCTFTPALKLHETFSASAKFLFEQTALNEAEAEIVQ